jgi:hypothetical protein
MKKTLLTLISLIAITGISYSQLPVPIGATADSFELSGATYTNGETYDYSGSGWYYRGGGAQTYYVRPNEDGTWGHIWFQNGIPTYAVTTDAELPVGTMPNDPLFEVMDWNNVYHTADTTTWTNNVVNPGYMASVGTWATANAAPTPTPAPTVTPSATPMETIGGNSRESAAEALNKNLLFQNGQWTPKL